MPKQTNGTRGGASATQRGTTSDRKRRDLEATSIDSLDFNSHGNSDAFQNSVTVLASSNGALQRLAGIAQYFETSFTHDISIVEGTHGADIDRENEIHRLNEALQILTHIKSEETENLLRENDRLKAGQEACEREREKCQTMQAELEARHVEAEADREKEYEHKLQEEKSKAQKQMKARRAEMEAGNKQRVQSLESENEKLSMTNEDLKQRLIEAQEKLQKKKIRYDRERKTLEQDNAELTQDLEQMKSEFPIESHPVEFYTEMFQEISKAVQVISSKYFQKLPERAITNPETVHKELCKLNAIFDSTPIWQTEVSQLLRLTGVQHIISTCLCDRIWRPFFPENNDSLPNHYQGVPPFLDAVANSLSATTGFGRGESVWRVLTLRGIDALSSSWVESSRQVESAVQHVLEMLRPLTVPSQLPELEGELLEIMNWAVKLWQSVRKDEARFVVAKYPGAIDKANLRPEDCFARVEDVSTPLPPTPSDAMTNDREVIGPFCLFPCILRTAPAPTPKGSDTMVVHKGNLLFADSSVWRRGLCEKRTQQEELAKAVEDAREMVSLRRSSLTAGSNGATGGTKVSNI